MKPDFNGNIRSKLPQAGTSIFTVMSALSAEHKAINLSQGFPDFEVDPQLIKSINKAMKSGHNQYAPMQGLLSLRERISEKVEKLYGRSYHPDTEITITAGATQAIYSAITAVVGEGDEVILFTPAYDCYAPTIKLNGGTPKYIQLKSPDFRIDWEEVKQAVNFKTKLIIINTPHNPSGTILSQEDMQALEKIVSGTDILILSDEVYEHIIFDGIEHQSVARYPGLAERSFAVYSFGKTFHATGWKMGYCLAPSFLMEEFRKIHQFQVFACNHPVQYGLAQYLENEENYLNVAPMYQEKRDLFCELLEDSRFVVRPSQGTYFQLLDYSQISDEEDAELAAKWTEEFKVSSIPVSVFYHNPIQNKVLRFCFAKQNETLEQAAKILRKI
ncbi:methionine aminotransferase [bacterium SCSIO 12741]|nr:methionine aminotransferase [bacterium SCSIO 12741]